MIDTHRKTSDGRVIQGSYHTSLLLNHKERNTFVMKTVSDLKSLDFDSVVCCGTSGLLIAPQVSEILDKNLVIIRKKNVRSYSPFDVEGVCPSNYIILDDLVCSGGTIKHIQKMIHGEYPYSNCLGAYFYFGLKDCYAGKDTKNTLKKDFGIKCLNLS